MVEPDTVTGPINVGNPAETTIRELAERIRHKYKIKNTTGYSLNALIDFDDPYDIMIHLMIGSEGTLGIITRARLRIHPQPEARRLRGAVAFDESRPQDAEGGGHF